MPFKHTLILLLVLILLQSFENNARAASEGLTAEEVVQIALRANPRVRGARALVRRVSFHTSELRASGSSIHVYERG